MENPKQALDFFAVITPAEAEEFHDTLGRPWTDVLRCIKAFYADIVATQLSALGSTEIRFLIWIKPEEEDETGKLSVTSVIHNVARRHGDDPFVVETKAQEYLQATMAQAGDYMKFLAFFEFVMQRRNAPDLVWGHWGKEVSSLEAAQALIKRIPVDPNAETSKDITNDLLTPEPQQKDEGGRPLQTAKEQG